MDMFSYAEFFSLGTFEIDDVKDHQKMNDI